MSQQHVLHGNNLDLLARMPDASVHAVVTDPPYGLNFMGKDWDKALPDPRTWSECLRVLRPGGHLVAFGAPRLVHRLTCQIEDAGFEIRDQLLWVFGCLSEDTEILVNGEWVHYRKAMAGSLAMCYDIDDDTFSEQPIEKLFVYDYDDTAYRIQSDGTDQIVSRTHKCIVQRGGRWVFDTAESVAREQQARVPVLEDVRGLLSELSVHEQNAAITPIHYTGKVWCVKVPTGAFVARRNGKIFVTGNSGFPKSLDVSKAIDKQDAVEEQEARRLRFTAWLRSTGVTSKQIDDATGTNMGGHYTTAASQPAIMTREHLDACRHLFGQVPEWVEQEANIRTVESQNLNSREVIGTITKGSSPLPGNHKGTWVDGQVDGTFNITAPATPEAAKWSGWGTALKPAYEPIVLARKPIDGTVAQTVQRWGTGALNIDGCRVETDDSLNGGAYSKERKPSTSEWGASGSIHKSTGTEYTQPAGRWPANLILDEDAGAMLDAQSGVRRSAGDYPSDAERGSDNATSFGGRPGKPYADSGGASRFFKQADFGEADRFMYCPKASRSEREAGLDHLPPRVVDPSRAEGTAGRESPRAGAGRGSERRNHHNTVKPIELMRWLVRLVTPPGGIVLEPFAGSGTTPAACALEGVDCIAMEIDAEYVEIARARVAHWRTMR